MRRGATQFLMFGSSLGPSMDPNFAGFSRNQNRPAKMTRGRFVCPSGEQIAGPRATLAYDAAAVTDRSAHAGSATAALKCRCKWRRAVPCRMSGREPLLLRQVVAHARRAACAERALYSRVPRSSASTFDSPSCTADICCNQWACSRASASRFRRQVVCSRSKRYRQLFVSRARRCSSVFAAQCILLFLLAAHAPTIATRIENAARRSPKLRATEHISLSLSSRRQLSASRSISIFAAPKRCFIL